jgi:paraquat-inducible protein B
MVATVKAAMEDLKGGHFFEAKTLLEAELFSDLLEQAGELSQAGYKDAAAVLAGAVLEKHLRSMCLHRGIGLLKPNGKHKMINDMNDELAKAGAYNALKKKQMTVWADLRNNAAHGNTAAYTAADVTNFLRDVSDFCANHS